MCRLKIGPLQRYWAGNAVLVKLVDQENLAAEHGERGLHFEGGQLDHQFEDERERPNITVSHVTFNGSHVVLPDGVALRC